MPIEIDDFQEYCEFGPERVYLLLAIARSKDNEGLTASSEPVIREIVAEAEELPETVARLDHAVSRFEERYRLYLSVNARDTTSALFRLRERTDDWLEMRFHGDTDVLRKFKRVDSEFVSVLQSDACADETNFLFDLDDVSADEADAFADSLADSTTVLLRRETPNGFHVVTEPFDYTRLSAGVEYELKTDDMVFVGFVGESSTHD
ncbi:hypothetical protein OB920_19220 [Halobacteria archaeon HArc-gm2]|nr:hypothetical protein [Halobacteria archaeon HArc-gm2]